MVLVQAFLTLGAIAAAIGAPYIAANIEARRRRRSAVKLAELTVTALRVVKHFYVGDETTAEEEVATAATLHLPVLVARMEASPTSDLDDPRGLEAFIRIAGAGKQALVAAGLLLDPANAKGRLIEMQQDRLKEVCATAERELVVLKRQFR